MKFGSKLHAYAIPEWRAAYIRYGALKALIKRYQRELAAAEYRHNAASQKEIQRSLQTAKVRTQEDTRK
ncbi:spx domain-containing protein, partial [Cystoisospora suis]